MEIAYKDFHRKMAPFREESLEDILENQVNQWIKLNNIQVINGYKCGNPLGEKKPRFGGGEGVVYQKVKNLSGFKILGSY